MQIRYAVIVHNLYSLLLLHILHHLKGNAPPKTIEGSYSVIGMIYKLSLF